MSLVNLVDRRADPDRRLVYLDDGDELRLSTREAELLSYLAERPDEPVSWGELLAEVWGYAEQVVSRAPYHTWRRLVGKLEADPREPRHCLSVHGVGVRLSPLPAPERVASPGVPLPVSDLVGRTAELRHLRSALRDAPVVTLVGPGGVGKTRLAAEVAGRAGSRWDEVVSVSLVQARSGEDAVRLIAMELGLSDLIDAGTARVEAALQGRGRVLLILDNLEQITGLAPIVEGLTRVAPRCTVLGTSREPLGARDEELLRVEPLHLPDAVALFEARAVGLDPSRAAAVRSELRTLVELLDRLPLAIELAAARTRLLTVGQLVERVERRFQLLRSAHHAAGRDPRHETLWATLAWSWDLLEPSERAVLTHLAAFRGVFTVEAAEAVAVSRDEPVLDVLERLHTHSLVTLDARGRVSLLLAVRDFVGRKSDANTLDGAIQRHAAWYAAWGDQVVPSAQRGDAPWAQLHPDDLDNLLVASERTTDPHVAAATAVAAGLWLADRGPMQRGAALIDAALQREGLTDDERTELLLARGRLLLRIDRQRALADFEAASTLARTCAAQARAALGVGTCLPPQQALEVLERARVLFETLVGIPRPPSEAEAGVERARLGVAHTLRSVCMARLRTGDLDGAAEAGRGAVEVFRALDHGAGLSDALEALATVMQHRGDLPAAEALMREGLCLARRHGNRVLESHHLSGLGAVAAERGDLHIAIPLLEAAAERVATIGARDLHAAALGLLGQVRSMAGQLDRARTDLVRALDLADRAGMRRLGMYEGVLAVVEARSGRCEQARRHMERVRANMGDERTAVRVELWVLEAEVELLCGSPERARDRLASAEGLARQLGITDRFRSLVAGLQQRTDGGILLLRSPHGSF